MFEILRRGIKGLLHYQPLEETRALRAAIDAAREPGLPFCPPHQGDLLYTAIRRKSYRRCLQTGFLTGSTALYMCAAAAETGGGVTSICMDDDDSVARGLRLLNEQDLSDRHTLIRGNSNRAIAEMFLAGERFDFVFIDGWKTFDHLAYELYLCNQMLETGGMIVFDDSYLPGVRKAIKLMRRFYGYRELDYSAWRQGGRIRLWQAISAATLHRPYRAIEKAVETDSQPPFSDWTFHKNL
jgi:predicted O-methyltransferase YrrM